MLSVPRRDCVKTNHLHLSEWSTLQRREVERGRGAARRGEGGGKRGKRMQKGNKQNNVGAGEGGAQEGAGRTVRPGKGKA